MNTYYTCRIDTTEYSGNFEREMVAFITGQTGECGVGEENAEVAVQQLSTDTLEWLEEYMLFTTDDRGCSRPAEIVPTPGWSNDGMGNNSKGNGGFPAYQSVQMRFEIEPPKNIKDLIRERANLFPKKGVERLGSLKNIKVTDVVFEKVSVKTTRKKI